MTCYQTKKKLIEIEMDAAETPVFIVGNNIELSAMHNKHIGLLSIISFHFDKNNNTCTAQGVG
ncbi:MAG: hypothetical protein ACI90V_009282 [Bacillariaceae sp.]|jgi:hypothetical protein